MDNSVFLRKFLGFLSKYVKTNMKQDVMFLYNFFRFYGPNVHFGDLFAIRISLFGFPIYFVRTHQHSKNVCL